MVIIGACVSPDSQDNSNAHTWFNCVEEVVFVDDDFTGNTTLTLDSHGPRLSIDRQRIQALQAAYTVCVYQNWEGTDISKSRIRRFRYATVVSTVRDIGITTAKHQVYSQQARHEFSWDDFVASEELIRTFLWVFLLDTGFVIFNNLPPRMVIKEMKMHMAAPEACFQAATEDECYQQIHKWLPADASYWKISFRTAFENICKNNFSTNLAHLTATLGPLNLFALISGIHALIFHFQNSFESSQLLLPIRTALTNWETAWQLYSTSFLDVLPHSPHSTVDNSVLSPEAMWKRVGFCRFSPEFWLLGRLMIDRLSAIEASGSENVDTCWEESLASLSDEPSDPILNNQTCEVDHNTMVSLAESGTLASKWPEALDLAGSNNPCRLEGEIGDLIVLGEIPKEIDGTFYRVMCDPFVPPHPGNVPIDGDGSVSAFRIHNGRVDMKIRYVETERYKLERKANRQLFGLYRNPFTHHPCVRAAVDSTANTNLVLWANQLLALKEVALPYSLDPNTLEMLNGQGEYRTYSWENCMPIPTGGAWEGEDGKLYFESTRVHDNAFPFFPPDDGRIPAPETKADFVRWEIDLQKPSGSKVVDPLVIVDVPSEFPRIDERFMTHEHEFVFLNVFIPQKSDGKKNIFFGLNGLAMHSHKTGQTRWFYPGDESQMQEPVFIPRSKDAPEGDGWVISMVERRGENRNDLVVIDTKVFEKPVAIIQLPFHVKAQIHGNWVDAATLGEWKSLVKEIPDFKISGLGALEPLFIKSKV
ncbi:hypothetical protein B7463_g2207, partial [Scytalidium lignicola]